MPPYFSRKVIFKNQVCQGAVSFDNFSGDAMFNWLPCFQLVYVQHSLMQISTNERQIPTLAVSNVCGHGCVNLHFQEMTVPFYVRHKNIYFSSGGGATGFLTPVVSYAPRPISR